MNRFLKGIPVLILLTFFLSIYAVVVALLTGRKAFFYDDYAILSVAFWDRIPYAYRYGAEVLRRPGQTFYFVTALKATEFNMVLMHLGSLLLQALACIGMGWVLQNIFPGRKLFIFSSVIFAFFSPITSTYTYVLAADNVRLSMIWFWIAVLLFQHTFRRSTQFGVISLFPVFAFSLSIMSYEVTALLFLAFPFLVWPIYIQNHRDQTRKYHFVMMGQLLFSGAVGLLLAIYIRSLYNITLTSHYDVFSGDWIGLLQQYLFTFFQIPLWFFSSIGRFVEPLNLFVGIGAAVVFGIFFVLLARSTVNNEVPFSFVVGIVPLAVFASVFGVLGMIPFYIGGLPPTLDNLAGTRIYLTGSFGLAILFGYVFDYLFRLSRYRVAVIAIASLAIGLQVVFHVGLRNPWREAYHIQQTLYENLYKLVPDVEEPATLLIDNFGYTTDDGIVFFSDGGVTQFISLFYQDRRINAQFLSGDAESWAAGYEPVVTQDRVITPGNSVPHNRVLLIRRVGLEFEFIDEITPESPYDVVWEEGATVLKNNLDLIPEDPQAENRFRRIIKLFP